MVTNSSEDMLDDTTTFIIDQNSRIPSLSRTQLVLKNSKKFAEIVITKVPTATATLSLATTTWLTVGLNMESKKSFLAGFGEWI